MLGRMTSLLAYTAGQWIAFLILVVPWVLLVVYALIDLFRKSHYSTGGKIAWLVVIVILPYIGSISYVVLRGSARMRSRGR
jgi:hypothetical protein